MVGEVGARVVPWVMASALFVGGCVYFDEVTPPEPDADAGGAVEAACEGVTCSGAGSCIELGQGEYECICELGFGGPECERCDFGYRQEGDECVLESLCEMFQCPGVQSCVEVGESITCVCPEGRVALDNGECVSPCDAPGMTPCEEDEVCVDDGGEVECIPPVDTCGGLRSAGLATEDGLYTLYYERDVTQPWQAYCHDMEGTPTEYLPLPNTGGFRNLFEDHAHNRQTSYDRVRIDPSTLRVSAQDDRFATTTDLSGPGGPPDTNYQGNIYFGTTGSCGGATDGGDPPGRGVIDLTGTPFFVEEEFEVGGACAQGEAQYLERGQLVELEATGTCGFIAPQANAEAQGNLCPNDPSINRPPNGQNVSTFTVRLGYSSDLLEP